MGILSMDKYGQWQIQMITELTESLIPTPPTLPTLAILPSLASLATQPSDTKKSDSEMIGQNTIWTKD